MKIAFSGSSGSGKTTLVKYLSQVYGIPHISGSAGDIKTVGDEEELNVHYWGLPTGEDRGHLNVIVNSAMNPEWGLLFQNIIRDRREEIIDNNESFVTDRSPADNLVYFINQLAYHPEITDEITQEFMEKCKRAWEKLDYVIYIKACQPNAVEDNGSRIANRHYQKTIDAQFEYWITEYLSAEDGVGPKVLIIDFWDLDLRKETILELIQTLEQSK